MCACCVSLSLIYFEVCAVFLNVYPYRVLIREREREVKKKKEKIDTQQASMIYFDDFNEEKKGDIYKKPAEKE